MADRFASFTDSEKAIIWKALFALIKEIPEKDASVIKQIKAMCKELT